MKKHHQLVTSLGATVVLADARTDFLIAEHDGADDAHLDEAATPEVEPVAAESDFGAALKSLLTSTTCHKF